jgi:nucleotide-binding universal stress UspA family protein
MTNPKGGNMFKNILVPTDGSKLSVKAAKSAVKLAKSIGAKVTGFYAAPDYSSTYYGDGYVLPSPSAKTQAEAAQKQARQCLSTIEVEAEVEKVPCEVFHVISDSPYEAIIDAAKKKKCDLILMASHGRRGLSGLVLGSETHKVLIHSKIPVLVCR